MHSNNASIKVNMMLNALKGLMSVVFPLVTFPYVSRVLGVDNLGKFGFANSIISYFLLIAGLGINTYAIQCGAPLRDNREELQRFTSEILTINTISTAISYGILFFLLYFRTKLYNYRALILILSIQILFRTIGVEWLYSIYEDYAYITIRSMLFQVISLMCLFLFIRDENDLKIYAGITVLSTAGSNILNYFHSRKYLKIKLTNSIRWKEHVKPIIVLFAMTATITVYVNSDNTILGFICGDYSVGIYSVSTKIYSIFKTILSSILIVSIPRLSALTGKNDGEGFNRVADDIYKTLITAVVPSVVGIIMIRKEIILVIASKEYLSATASLLLLGIALFFCMGAWFWGQCVLIPYKMENKLFVFTLISAMLNLGMNFLFIPLWQEKGAAITTILAEGTSFLLCAYEGRKRIRILGLGIHYVKVFLGCVPFVLIGHIIKIFNLLPQIYLIIIIPISIILFLLVEVILKNESVNGLIYLVKKTVLFDPKNT